jgi:C4-dicarboxylate-binding protein DctP
MSATKALRKPEDMKGLKMRIQSSKVSTEMRARALPQVMAFSEVYQAMQTAWSTARKIRRLTSTQKMHEVQKYLTLTDHGVIEYAVIANKKFWTGCLPTSARRSKAR